VSRARALVAALAAGLVVLAIASSGAARPQITSGVTMGAALTDMRAENGPRLAYHLGGRLDLLFGREAPRDMAFGPYLELVTAAFDTFETGGGAAWLVPTAGGATAFVFSAGAFARTSRFGLEPGLTTAIFWGARGLNYHSAYATGTGVFVQGRYGLGSDGRQADAVVGVQLDLEYLALPWVLAYAAITR
jgi:hypothetical protein